MRKNSLGLCLVAMVVAGCGANGSGVGIEAFVCTDKGTYTVEEAADLGYTPGYRGKCGEPMGCGSVWDCFAGDECMPTSGMGGLAEKRTIAPPDYICVPGPYHCGCPGVLAPVCGSDGLTYINECEAACVDVDVVHEGRCEQTPCDVRPLQNGFTATCESAQYPGIEGVIETQPHELLALGRSFSGSFEVIEPPLGFVVEGEATLFCDNGELTATGSADTPIGYLTVECWDIQPINDERECNSDDDCQAWEHCAFRDIACPVGEPCPLDDPDYDPARYSYGVCEDACALIDCAPGHSCFHGQCLPEPCGCPEIYQPVCGVDGNTYSNRCEAECAGVAIAHEGQCGPDCRELGCLEGWTCDYCEGAYECLSPLAGACPPPDCRVTGCDEGDYCTLCWVDYACIPVGAVC